MNPHYHGNSTTIYCKDCRDMSELPDESVQCFVTSPPYFGLRKYSGDQELVWGGNGDCEHEWGVDILGNTRRENFKDWGNKGSGIDAPHIKVRQGAFCSKCTAWRGAYGLEPTIELYVDHSIEILREIRRVLRKDGVCFFNLGDSYYASGGAHKPEHANPGLSKSSQRGGVPHGGKSDKRGKELLGFSVSDFLSQNPCGECVRILLNHNLDTYDYHALALAAASILSNHSHKEQQIAHSGNLDLAYQGGRSASGISGLCSFAKLLDGVEHGALESTNLGVSAGFPHCPYAPSCWDCPSLIGIISHELQETNSEVCPFWLCLLSQGIQGLTASISSTLEIDGASAVRIKDTAYDYLSSLYSIIPQHPLNLKPKDLCLIPSRVAIAAQADGWFVRSDIIWNKRNPMPESVNDRPTNSHEYVWMFTKSGTPQYWTHRDIDGTRKRPKADYRWVNERTEEEVAVEPLDWREKTTCPECKGEKNLEVDIGLGIMRWEECEYCHGKGKVRLWKRINLWKGHDYYWDADAVREPHLRDWSLSGGGLLPCKSRPEGGTGWATQAGRNDDNRAKPPQLNPNGRNIRSVWEIATQPYPEAHFATFPEELVARCVKAATPEVGCCSECGAPWSRVSSRNEVSPTMRDGEWEADASRMGIIGTMGRGGRLRVGLDRKTALEKNPGYTTLGWRPTCRCNAEVVPSLVDDPMVGSGTTLWVAKKLGRRAVGYDTSREYCELAVDRNRQMALELNIG